MVILKENLLKYCKFMIFYEGNVHEINVKNVGINFRTTLYLARGAVSLFSGPHFKTTRFSKKELSGMEVNYGGRSTMGRTGRKYYTTSIKTPRSMQIETMS